MRKKKCLNSIMGNSTMWFSFTFSLSILHTDTFSYISFFSFSALSSMHGFPSFHLPLIMCIIRLIVLLLLLSFLLLFLCLLFISLIFFFSAVPFCWAAKSSDTFSLSSLRKPTGTVNCHLMKDTQTPPQKRKHAPPPPCSCHHP